MLRVIVVDDERLWSETFADELRIELDEKYGAPLEVKIFDSGDDLVRFYDRNSFPPHVCVFDVDFTEGGGGELEAYHVLIPLLTGLRHSGSIPREAVTFLVSGVEDVLRDRSGLSEMADFAVEALLPKGQVMRTGFLTHVERLVSEKKLPPGVLGLEG